MDYSQTFRHHRVKSPFNHPNSVERFFERQRKILAIKAVVWGVGLIVLLIVLTTL